MNLQPRERQVLAHDMSLNGGDDAPVRTTVGAELRLKLRDAIGRACKPRSTILSRADEESIRATRTAALGNGAPFGGIKVIAENGWFAARPSGTEDVYKIYAESFRSEKHLHQIQQAAQDAIAHLFQSAKPA